MCGRYHVSDETAKEMEKLVRQAEGKLHRESAAALRRISSTVIRPSDKAPVLLLSNGTIACAWLQWGFPIQREQGKGLVFNARCESAAEKPFFSEGIRHRRIAVPASSFYEWNREKIRYTFQREDRTSLFMAGCCRHYSDGEHFVILTTSANSSMQPIHDRMPLLLKENDVVDWILEPKKTEEILRSIPYLLAHCAEYEQLRFF